MSPGARFMVVAVANERLRQQQQKSSLKDKEPKKLSLLGRKSYFTANLQVSIENYQAFLSKSDFINRGSFTKFTEKLSSELRKKFVCCG